MLQMVFGNCGVLAEVSPNKGYVEMTGIDAATSRDIADVSLVPYYFPFSRALEDLHPSLTANQLSNSVRHRKFKNRHFFLRVIHLGFFVYYNKRLNDVQPRRL